MSTIGLTLIDLLIIYEVSSDPFNMNNLAEDVSYQEITVELADKLQQYLEQTEDPWAIVNAK